MENLLPTKVKIAGIEYQVKEVEGNLEKFNNLGQINYWTTISILETNYSYNQMMDRLLRL